MVESKKIKQYDLEERTFSFAKEAMEYVRNLPKNITNNEIGRQLARAAGSVGANYIEANESLSKKDFVFRIKISRKEAKESEYWIKLTTPKDEGLQQKEGLINEAVELTKIFGAILKKTQQGKS